MTTYFQSKEEGNASRKWFVVDATGVPLGRLASEVAALLRGKHKPTFTRHTDGGDFVVIVNASKVALTGNKASDKLVRHHTGYVGGLKTRTAGQLRDTRPEILVTESIKGMLPGGPLGAGMLLKLKVYRTDVHPHQAQQPEIFKLRYFSPAA